MLDKLGQDLPTSESNLYKGFLRSTLYCENDDCRFESYNTNEFTTLPLPLCNGVQCTLMECLNLFCEEEVFTKAEVALCENCKRRTATKKKFKVTIWPKLLVIHLNRFKEILGESGQLLGHKRLNTAVSFPLSNFAVAAYPSILYNCVGVVNHTGGCFNGHYTADVLREESWFHFNDNITPPIKIESPEGSLNVFNSQAYLLFFVRQSNAPTIVEV